MVNDNNTVLRFNTQTKLTSPTSSGAAAVNNPFLSSPTSSGNIVDLFGASNQPTNTKASDDLLQLGNPFADMFGPAPAAAAPAPAGNNMWMGNGKHFFTIKKTDPFLEWSWSSSG